MEIFRKQNWQLCWTVKAFCQILRDLIFVLTSNLFSTGITNMEVQAAVRDPDLAAQYSAVTCGYSVRTSVAVSARTRRTGKVARNSVTVFCAATR